MLFLEFIVTNARRDDQVGDFCEDTLRLIKQKKYPKNYSLGGMMKFMQRHGASEEAIEACKQTWCEWKSVI